MTWLYWVCGILLFFVLICVTPVTFELELADRVRMHVRVWFFRHQIFPKKIRVKAGSINYKKMQRWRSKQARLASKKKQKAEKKKTSGDEEEKPKGFKDQLDLYTDLVKSFFRPFRKHLTVKLVRFRIVIGSDDAAKTAILYGTIAQSVAYLLEIIRQTFRLKLKRGEEVEVRADYASDLIQAELLTAFTLRIWHVFPILGSVAGAYLRSKLKKKSPDPVRTKPADQIHTQAT